MEKLTSTLMHETGVSNSCPHPESPNFLAHDLLCEIVKRPLGLLPIVGVKLQFVQDEQDDSATAAGISLHIIPLIEDLPQPNKR